MTVIRFPLKLVRKSAVRRMRAGADATLVAQQLRLSRTWVQKQKRRAA